MKPSSNAIVLAASFVITGCASGPVDDDAKLPDIVEVFACSDYCPGPEEKYAEHRMTIDQSMITGIVDGASMTFIGWGVGRETIAFKVYYGKE